MPCIANIPTPTPKRYVRAIGPRLRPLLWIVFALAALLAGNSVYLVAVHLLEQLRGAVYQNYFYQCMFLAHLAMGLLVVVPFIIFGIGHIRNAHDRPKRRAVRMGYALFAACLVLLITGIALVRFDPFVMKSAVLRSAFYWAHVSAPVAVIWLYVLHRLAGPRIKWKAGLRWAVPAAIVIGLMVYLNSRDPRQWNVSGPREGMQYFQPSLARTGSGKFIPAASLMNDRYCMECHKDNYQGWFHSAHHFSSFNNPAYLFSVRETRRVSLARDGNVHAARWCAGCHDTVPFFSGAFDRADYDDVHDPTAGAGITCTSCHAITHINSTRGNADYTIEEPIQYPFATSENRFLQFVNRQLIKARPEFHKLTFLKPLHKTAEFCSVCHKVSIPGDLNHYKDFLRGQNHYDTYLLSGVSGHSARSFYYPEKATPNCAGCHMPAKPSEDFAATAFDPTQPGVRMVHDHFFPGGNTGIPALRDDAPAVKTEQTFLKEAVRVDLFGIKAGGEIDSPVTMLRPTIPVLTPGRDYLLEVVVRTLKLGHPFTQGTTDSNEVWLDVRATDETTNAPRVIAENGGMEAGNAVDPWAYFFNTYMLDRDGHRIDRRNVQDIFTPLYSHQIPPGAASVVHYRLHVPEDQAGPITMQVKLQYRKFSARYMQYIQGGGKSNGLPITTMATDAVTFEVARRDGKLSGSKSAVGSALADAEGAAILTRFRFWWHRANPASAKADPTSLLDFLPPVERDPAVFVGWAYSPTAIACGALPMVGEYAHPALAQSSPIPPWQRWNDYGIALFLEGNLPGDNGELLQAERAFQEEEKLGRSDGPVNLARVYFKQGRLDEAGAALDRAGRFCPPAPAWTIAWLRGMIDGQGGNLDRAIAELQSVTDDRWPAAEGRGFNFSKDVEVLNLLGQTLFDRAKQAPTNSRVRKQFLLQARDRFEQSLAIDSENLPAHYALSQVFDELGETALAAEHRAAHARYRPDDNARDRAVMLARQRDKAADHAAGAVVIYELSRPR